jgi:hypothetical protein
MKRRRDLYLKFIIITVVVTAFVTSALIFFNANQNRQNSTSTVVFSNEFYTLRGRPTDLQKSLFKDLTAAIELSERDELEIVTLVAKNFISDYFTWSNKTGPFDVGGLDFVFGLENLNFRSSSRTYFYSYIYTYLVNGVELKDLIEVAEIEPTIAAYAAPYQYYDRAYTAFYIELSWIYKESDIIDTSIFQRTAAMTIILTDTGRYEIVRFY